MMVVTLRLKEVVFTPFKTENSGKDLKDNKTLGGLII